MPKVSNKPVQGTDKPALHPVYLRQCRTFALLAIIDGLPDADVKYLPADKIEHITDELDALKAQGVGPKRAEILLKRLKDGREFQVIPGGGETVETLRAVLSLVGAP